MRLIIKLAILTFITIESKSQNINDFKYSRNSPGPDMFSSDPSSLYLPPENTQQIPLFPMKNMNNLQFPYLPATGTKAPSIYPTPFPMMMASSLVPNFDDDEDDNETDENEGKIQLSSPPTPPRQNFSQNSERLPNSGNKEPRMLPRPIMYHKQPIDRADVKQLQVPPGPMMNSQNVRRMIISSENARSDQVPDQIKTGSHPGFQFLPSAQVYNLPTTEPAIPILRLSNEMDLDGSFSYEALGADQTHYVQHSRMENMGTDKEEQVVEGSYSYVGDNGQTYTVHYVADSNGFRASGDHLPIPPPVPEIIQRAVQYNIEEESKRPLHLKSQWEGETKDYEVGEREKNTFSVLPPRNLFTGRTPEAFSYSYGHPPPANPQNNNIAAAASNQVSVKTVDFSKEQSNQNKPNNGPIAPQVTFLASQGAHLPSANSPPQEPPSISRMFPAERLLPQLLSYQAKMKENEDNNKALWRWQYGANPNNVIRQAKNSISRSSSDAGDDVMINFNNMTPEEYTNMINSQYTGNDNEAKGFSQNNNDEYVTKAPNHNYNSQPNQNYIPQGYVNSPQTFGAQQQKVSFPHSSDWFNKNTYYNNYNNNISQSELALQPEPQTLPESSIPYNQPQLKLDQKTLQQQQLPLQLQAQQQYSQLQIQNPTEQQYLYPQQQYLPSQQQIETENIHTQVKENNAMINKFEDNKSEQSKEFKHITTTAKAEKEYNTKSYLAYKTESPTTIANKQEIINTESATTFDYESDFYDVKKVSSQDLDNVHKIYSTAPNMYWISTEPTLPLQIKVTTPEPVQTSTYSRNLQFSDFIVKDVQDDFKPITYSNKESQLEREVTTTTTESTTSLKEMLDNNIFLKNIVKSDNSRRRSEYIIPEESKKQTPRRINMEPKEEKAPKYIYPAQNNDVKIIKNKPLDMGELLNFVAMKNHFESNKVKGINKPLFPERYTPRRESYYTNSNEEYDDEEEEEKKTFSVKKNLNQQQQHELRGFIRNYKVLQRNNNVNHENHQNRNDYKPIPLKMMHPPSNLPPLGRAGPTVKAYLPPIYV